MSHMSEYKTQISNTDPRILQAAFEAICQEEPFTGIGILPQTQLRWSDFAIDPTGQGRTSGYGVMQISAKGPLKISFDTDGNYNPHVALMNQFRSRLEQTYQALAIIQAAAQMGYNVQSISGQPGQTLDLTLARA